MTETVADVLHAIAEDTDPGEYEGMLQLLDGDCEAADLSYEDWARPMKHSGGKIVVKQELPTWDGPCYVRWTAQGMQSTFRGLVLDPSPACAIDLKMSVEVVRRGGSLRLTPVHVDDTPFPEWDAEDST